MAMRDERCTAPNECQGVERKEEEMSLGNGERQGARGAEGRMGLSRSSVAAVAEVGAVIWLTWRRMRPVNVSQAVPDGSPFPAGGRKC